METSLSIQQFHTLEGVGEKPASVSETTAITEKHIKMISLQTSILTKLIKRMHVLTNHITNEAFDPVTTPP